MKKQKTKIILAILLILTINLILINAVADFDVNSFSCTPSEVVVNNVFSCTAQLKNNGDVAGSVSVATLYPDAGNWLEESNYAQASGTSVDPGQTTEVIFTGLKATKSGNNGFLKIMLDDVTDTYIADENIRVNIINVVVTVDNSASSTAMGATFDATAEVSAGGNIDVSLTFTVNSGGCTIGTQTNPKAISGMNDGNTQSSSWTVTQGSSGNCRFTISASATGTGGIASKIDSTSSTVTCSNCPTDSSSSSSGGGGGAAGAGGSATKTYELGDLTFAQAVELGKNEKAKFNISREEHSIKVNSLTETQATITVSSLPQTFTISVEEERLVDFNDDNISEISIKLKSINIITNKASLVIKPISTTMPDKEKSGEEADNKKGGSESTNLIFGRNKIILIIIIIFIIIAVISGYFAFRNKFKDKSKKIKWEKKHI